MDTQASSQAGPTLSVVVPLLNEQAVLHSTYEHLKRTLDGLAVDYELIFVDDGSTDDSRAILQAKSKEDPSVRVVSFSRNFGHEMATTAGLHFARGRAAVVIDADLQDPPEVIEEFLRLWREGYEVVYGVRASREGESGLKKATSFLFYRLMRSIGDVPIPRDTGDFRLLDRRVLDVFRALDEDPRFFRGLISWIGFRQIGVPFHRRPRAAGESKYRYNRLVKLAFDTITAFSSLPALVITLVAFALAAASACLAGVTAAGWLIGLWSPPAWGWVSLGFLMLWNLQFLALAVLGEYIVRTHRHTQRRPLYVIDCVIENGQRTHGGTVPRPGV